MSDYYSITVKITFGVMANDMIEAEELAQQMCPVDDAPLRSLVNYYAYLTPNQEDRIKAEAINYESY